MNYSKDLSLYIKFKLWLSQPFLILMKQYKIREDFSLIYIAHVEEMYKNSNLVKRTLPNNEWWFHRACTFGWESDSHEPHKKIITLLENAYGSLAFLDTIISKIQYIFYGFLLFLVFFGISSFGLFTWYDQSSNLIFRVLFYLFLFGIVLIIYKKILSWDTDLHREINSKLKFNITELHRFSHERPQSKTRLIAATIWNKSLSDNRTISRLFIMLFLKITLKPLYNYVLRSMIEILPNYLENLLKKEKSITILKSVMRDFYNKIRKERQKL